MRFAVLLLAMLLPFPALALSCLAPTVERSYTTFAAEEEVYIVVTGKLSFDPTRMPRGMTDVNPPALTRLPARLRGTALMRTGFDLPFDREIVMEVMCSGPWCGGTAPNTDTLLFLRQIKDGYALTISPCGGSHFPEPTSAQVETVERCMREGTCE